MWAEGFLEPFFKEVADVLESNFMAGRELGAAVALTLDGQTLMDTWAGSTLLFRRVQTHALSFGRGVSGRWL